MTILTFTKEEAFFIRSQLELVLSGLRDALPAVGEVLVIKQLRQTYDFVCNWEVAGRLARCRYYFEGPVNRLGLGPQYDAVWEEVDYGLWPIPSPSIPSVEYISVDTYSYAELQRHELLFDKQTHFTMHIQLDVMITALDRFGSTYREVSNESLEELWKILIDGEYEYRLTAVVECFARAIETAQLTNEYNDYVEEQHFPKWPNVPQSLPALPDDDGDYDYLSD